MTEEVKEIKPSVIPSIYNIIKRLETVGLKEEDLITLLQRKTKLTRGALDATIHALKRIERDILHASEKYEKTV